MIQIRGEHQPIFAVVPMHRHSLHLGGEHSTMDQSSMCTPLSRSRQLIRPLFLRTGGSYTQHGGTCMGGHSGPDPDTNTPTHLLAPWSRELCSPHQFSNP